MGFNSETALLIAGIAGPILAYFALNRRRLTFWYAGARMIAEPGTVSDFVITHRGEVVEQPVYLVTAVIRCAGNRDVAMAETGEFIQIDVADGIELLEVRYGAPGKTEIKRLDASPRMVRFKFDLLKRRQEIALNLYVRTAIVLGDRSLGSFFPTTVHVKDVRRAVLATHRYESLGGLISTVGFFGLVGGFYFFAQFAPVDQNNLLLDVESRRVQPRKIEGTTVQICEATAAFWNTSDCRDTPLAEVAAFKPAPPVAQDFYVNPSPLPWRILSLTILFVGVVLSIFGRSIVRWFADGVERLFRRR